MKIRDKQEKVILAAFCCAFVASVFAGVLAIKTRSDLLPTADALQTVRDDARKLQVLIKKRFYMHCGRICSA